MQVLLDSERFRRNYNCSFYDYNRIPRESRQNTVAGVVLLVLYGIFEVFFSLTNNCDFYHFEAENFHPQNIKKSIILLFFFKKTSSCSRFLSKMVNFPAQLQVLYPPCLGVFMRKENRKESCYKLMLFMGILSMISIHSSGLIIGIYAIRGDVFCDRPLFNYVLGMPAFGWFIMRS